ncbi:hypothetical protein [Paenibacillus sp. Y412MC10]|uniref:hypothetical protein n=1 Tax=Geobacillus sp. (strain Y412MC10) TaxID=481743 RepID=UPI001642AC39|nr:hypothetical protein [Paenibacillus sp. Y412MC10]
MINFGVSAKTSADIEQNVRFVEGFDGFVGSARLRRMPGNLFDISREINELRAKVIVFTHKGGTYREY